MTRTNRRAQRLFGQFVDAAAEHDPARATAVWTKALNANAAWAEESEFSRPAGARSDGVICTLRTLRSAREIKEKMNVDDLILVSVDDHVIEPAHMFEGRVAKRYADKAPRFVRRENGTMAWVYEGQEILNPALNAVAGRPPSEFGMEPTYDRGDPPGLL